MREGEVGTEIAPIIDSGEGDDQLAERVDAILRRTCSPARALTGAEQAALKLWVDEEPSQARKYFSLSAKYVAYQDYRPNLEDDSESIRELAALVGDTLDALRAASW